MQLLPESAGCQGRDRARLPRLLRHVPRVVSAFADRVPVWLPEVLSGAEELPPTRVEHGTITSWIRTRLGGVVDGAVVGLAAAIEALRAELTDAVGRGRDEPMQFRVEPIELTVQAAVTKEADGKIGWSVLGLGGKYEAATTQTLTLRLAPMWRAADGGLTTDFMIAAAGEAGDTFGPQRSPGTERC